MMWQKTKQIINKNSSYILLAVQFALLLLIFIPQPNFEVTSFSDRVMGNGLMADIDVTRRVNYFYLLLFVLLPITSILLFKGIKVLLQNTDKRALKFMELISILGIINTGLGLANKIQNSEVLLISIYVLTAINVMIILSIAISKIQKKQYCFQNAKWAIISALPIAFVTALILHKLNITIVNNNINWLISYIVGVIALYILISLKFVNKEILKKAYIFFLIAPLLEMIYIEAYNILNQHNIILMHKIRTIVVIYGLCAIMSIVYYFLNQKKKTIFRYTKVYYPILLVTFGMMIAAITMTTEINTEFFESANHGVGVYEFFRYGKIPIIETFDAHMLSNQIFGIIYGVLNKDILGAVFILYNSYKEVIYCIVIYYFLKKVFSRDTAFFITLFFPLQLDTGMTMYYMALIAIITLINAIKKKQFISYLWYWISLAVLCIWQLDIGYSISIATVIVLIYISIKERKTIKLKNIIVPCLIVIGIVGLFFISACCVKHINPVSRAIEFAKLAMSNVNWGRENIGDVRTFTYVFCYYIMPIIIGGSLIYNFYSKHNKNKITIILLVFALFYILNMQRGMIRHSIVENTTRLILNFAFIYIVIFIMQHKHSKKIFLSVYISFLVISNLLISTIMGIYINKFDKAISKYNDFKLQDECYDKKQERIKLSNSMKKEYRNLKLIFDEILTEEETYMDFSNQTLLYALLDREKPVYVNQSPGLLSGEKSQQIFVEEIQNNSKEVKLVLMAKDKNLSNKLDGIANNYRYYLLSEYIYQNYKPIANIDGYEIWARKENYDEILEKIRQVKIDISNLIISEADHCSVRNIELGYIPYIWNEYDKKPSKDIVQKIETNLSVKEEQVININLKETNKKNGNYLRFEIETLQDANISITLLENETEIAQYTFTTVQGKHSYVIRCSTTYGWYEKNVNTIQIKSEQDANLKSLVLLEANTIK